MTENGTVGQHQHRLVQLLLEQALQILDDAVEVAGARVRQQRPVDAIQLLRMVLRLWIDLQPDLVQ